MLMVPAVHGHMVRIFLQEETWFIASNQRVEALLHVAGTNVQDIPPKMTLVCHDLVTATPNSNTGEMFVRCLEHRISYQPQAGGAVAQKKKPFFFKKRFHLYLLLPVTP